MNALRLRHLLVTLLLVILLTVFLGCTLTMRTYPPPPHPPPPGEPHRGPLTREEIVDIASWIARDRGYTDFWIEEIEREDDHEWEVEIEGFAGGERGELELLVDGWDGRLLKVKDKREHREHDDD